ncbi:MAG: hypothetical protein LBC62_02865 [Treponema sp.]|jgi:hypothetical protein|nr:hypothetical protein [Treponema sp.]
MANKKSYIPHSDAEFDTFVRNILMYVSMKCDSNPPVWTHIPQEARAALAEHYAAWHAAYEITLTPCTRPQIAEKNRLHKVTEKAVRDFVNIYLRYHPAVTEEDKRNMGLTIPDTTRTPVVVPDEGPAFLIVQLGPRILGINYQYGQGRKGSKPPGIKGARIYYGVFDEPPDEQEKLPASVWATRCPHGITFRETDRGKRAYFALRWEAERDDEKSQSGWSEMASEIIP